MMNLLKKLKNNYCKAIILNLSVVLIFIAFAIYIFNYVWLNVSVNSRIKECNFAVDKIKLTNKDSLSIDLNSKIYNLQTKIDRVELSNDKRFEVFGWTFGVLCSFILVIMFINYYNSKAALKDLIREEIDKVDEIRNKKLNKIISNLEEEKEFYEKERLKQQEAE